MRKPHRLTISQTLVMDNLREACEEVGVKSEELDRARYDRDRMIQDVAEYVPIARLARITHLSRESLYRIIGKAGQSES